MHLAGGYWVDDELVDGHCSPVHEESWQLLDALMARGAPVQNVILEHDTDFPEISQLIEQVERARCLTGSLVR